MRREKADGAEASDEGSGAPAARRTIASLSATDAVADALEAADAEERRTADHAASGMISLDFCETCRMKHMIAGKKGCDQRHSSPNCCCTA